MGIPGRVRWCGAGDHPLSHERGPKAVRAARLCWSERREGEESTDHTIHHVNRVWRGAYCSLVGLPDALVEGASVCGGGQESATIKLAPDQKVISTGPYALVRHPMYFGGLIMFVGIPLALGSWWGLLVFALMVPAIIWRLLDEEKFLENNLMGYSDYRARVTYRLILFVW
jgi:protein-S-isoprenylcysteine O-methyltransferase Ste14